MDLFTPVKSSPKCTLSEVVLDQVRANHSFRQDAGWFRRLLLVLGICYAILPMGQTYAQSYTCQPGNVGNMPIDPWSEECYLSDLCTLQGIPCTSFDVTLLNVYVTDVMGQPLAPCITGDPQTVYLWGNFSNSAAVDLYAVRSRTEIWINGMFSTELINCSFDILSAGSTSPSLLGTISYQCGDNIQLLNTWIAWTKIPSQCSDSLGLNYANECNDYLPSRCSKDLAFIALAPCALTITCPPADGGTFECSTQIPPADTDLVIITDSCGAVTITFTESSTGTGCGIDTLFLTRIYTIVDDSTTLTCTQVFKATDDAAPVITCPANVTVQCNTSTSTGTTGTASAVDNCDATPTLTLNESTTAGPCPQAYTITRTWTAEDDCGNTSTCSQVIEVVDTNPPAIECPPNVTIECDASTDTSDIGDATATDNCDPDPVIFFTDYPNNPPLSSPEMRWVLLPANAMNGSCVSGTDCANGILCFSLQYTPGVSGTLTSYTTGFLVNCDGGNDPIISNMSCVMDDNSGVQEDCGGSGLILMNSSGNTGELPITQNVPVVLHQICIQLSPGGSITLDEDEATDLTTSIELESGGQATELPSFSNYNINLDAICNQVCVYPFVIYRQFVAVDACGNQSTCLQQITLQDMTPPVITCPPNVTIECDASTDPADTGMASATDNCSDTIIFTHVDLIIPRGVCPQNILIIRTWTATDECGNSSSCFQGIIVGDHTPPLITCPPNLTLHCDAITTPGGMNGMATATDNCDTTVIITSMDVIVPGGTCTQEYTINRIWSARDDCNNISTCTQVIMVDDSTPPVITCPQNITLECSAITTPGGANGMASATDNCDTTPSITSTDVTSAGPCQGSYNINRTWRATDDCGNSSTCIQLITVIDTVPPIITCPVNITIECGTSTAVANTGNATATDLCDPTPTITFTDLSSTPPGPGPSMQWLYFPPGATSGSCTSGTDCAAGIICFVLEYTPGVTGTLTSYTTGFFVNCYNNANPVVTNESCVMADNSGTLDDCLGSGLILMNSSGNSGAVSLTQDVPIILHQICLQLGAGGSVILDEDEATDLTASIDLPGGGLITETPSFNNFTVDFDTYCGQDCQYPITITRVFSAADDCGNSSTCVQLITIQDSTPPVITCPPSVTIECNTSTDPSITGMATATDNCSAIDTFTYSDITIPRGTCPEEVIIIRHWVAIDACGNSSSCNQAIVIEDSTPPVLTCPPNLTLECSDDTSTSGTAGMATATDNCDVGVTIAHLDDVDLIEPCNPTQTQQFPQSYLINRLWIATDDCGNSSTCLQLIAVQDTTPPAITCPPDLTIQCTDNTLPTGANGTGTATATDNCGEMTFIDYTDVTIAGACPQAYTILRTWSATDGCDTLNINTCTQTITVIDTVPPSFFAICQLVFNFTTSVDSVDCPADATISLVPGQIIGESENWTVGGVQIPNLNLCLFDNCSDPDSLVARVDSVVITGTSCIRTFTVYMTIIDQCGNESVNQFICVVNIIDDVAPVITCPDNVAVECNSDTSSETTGVATATDDCQSPTAIILTSSDVTVAGSCPQEMTIIRTWMADDGCGNTSVCMQTIMVQDTTPPGFFAICQLVFDFFTSADTVECPAVASISLVPGQIIGESENWTAGGVQIPNLNFCLFDNCTDPDSLVARVDSIPITGDACDRTFTVYFTIIDQCGNESDSQFVCVVNIHDDVAPVITCPADLSIECNTDTTPQSTGTATATDDCQTAITITFSDVTVAGSCPQEMIIQRTWTADDGCDNVSTCLQMITVQDTIPPGFFAACQLVFDFFTSVDTIDCPAAATISLVPGQIIGESENWTAGGVQIPNLNFCLFDNCTDPDSLVARVDSIPITGDACDRTFTVYFTIIDQCGNESDSQFVCVVNFHDDVAPVITCPADLTLNCDDDTSPQGAGTATATDDCQSPTAIIFTSSDVTTAGSCPQEMTIIRTWMADDGCGNTSSCIQTIMVQDTTPPGFFAICQLVFDFFTSADTVECPGVATISLVPGQIIGESENWTAGGVQIPNLNFCLFDNCSDPDSLVARVDSIPITGDACVRTFTVYFTIIDQCGNESDSQFVCVVNIHDDVAPVITCPANLAVQCNTDTSPATTGIATAIDDCNATPIITSSDVTIASTVCPQEYTINRTWMASDTCGNSSSCVQVILVDDSTPPVITCPANLTLECTASTAPGGANGTATATDNCDATPTITSTDVTVASPTCPQEYTINRTWIATDDCGNSSTCLQVILVDDTTPPAITCPADLTIECSVSSAPGGTNGTATATDNCDTTPTITSTDVTVASPTCPQEYTINRTWMAADDCGNSSTCLQVIVVDDSTPPVITCPADLTIECSVSSAPGGTNGTATATDNCDTTPTITSTDVTVASPTCPQEYTINRTWMATDTCGNSSTCVQVIVVDDSTPPVITCPVDLTIECTASTAPGGTNGTATATDNCDATPTITSTDVTVASTTCPQEYTINRTWMATDTCGNSSTCVQVIVVDDSTPPVITCPADLTIECSVSSAPGGTNGTATATDNCDATPTITSTDVTVASPTCPQEYTINRTWMATDTCGNSSTCLQVILVDDSTPPVITCPADLTIECSVSSAPGGTNGTATATDNCDTTPTITSTDVTVASPTCPQEYTINRTWMAADDCGNSSTCLQVIVVDDSTPPVITCPADLTIECSVSSAPGGTNGTATATDNCDTTPTITSTDVTVASPTCPQEYTINRTWMATDTCGNSSTCVQVIVVDDSTPPVITCPVDLTIECTASTAPGGTNGTATATDNCDATPTITSTDVTVASTTCPQEYTINRTWMATDTCGNSSTCVQVIVVDDSTPPVITCPADLTIECSVSSAPGGTNGTATATDNCDATPTITSTDVTVASPTCPQEYTINRTWMATDTCGNSSTCLQVILVDDSTPPVITCPADLTIECSVSSAPGGTNGTATATDNCDTTPTITSTDVTVASPTCPQEYTINRTWMAADDCGNSSTCLQVIVVDDSTPPVITCPADLTIECTASTAPGGTNGTATATDNCDATPTITSTDVTVASTTCPQEYTINRTWMATDTCGNSSTCLQVILVDDSTPPVITCPPNLTIECTASTAPGGTNGIATATDNCDATPTITSTDVTVTSTTCPQEYTINRTWMAADDCGNSSTCLQVILVDDSTPPVITCPANLTIECSVSSAPGGANGTATATDNCDATPTITSTDVTVASTTCPQEYTINRTWSATDDCGNSSTCLQVILVDDSTPPVITCPADLTIDCSVSTSAGGANGTATATDNCDATPTITSTDVTVPGSCPQELTILRTWRATDDCGNSSSCLQTIMVQDTTPPGFFTFCQLVFDFFTSADTVECPAVATISLVPGQIVGENENWTAGGVQVPSLNGCLLDNCSNPDSLVARVDSIPVTGDACDRTFTVYFTIIDQCGNESDSQFVCVVNIHDDVAPVITCPADLTIDCEVSLDTMSTGTATATDDCQSAVIITSSDVIIPGSCPQEMIIERTWTADDGCDNVSTCLQLIMVQDTTPPTIICPPNLTVACRTDVPPINPGVLEVSDNCSDTIQVVHIVDFVAAQTCFNRFLILRFYRATDECGNSATCVQAILVFDNIPPVITCPPDLTIECTASTAPGGMNGTATATDNCTGGPPVITSTDATVAGACPQELTITRTWMAADVCGNTSTCIQTIFVDDSTPPVITCPPDLTLECTASTAPGGTNGTATATDNCDPTPTITSTDVTVASPTCPQEYTINRTWMASDSCGNSSTCVQVIVVDDSTPPVITCPPNLTIECSVSSAPGGTNGTATATDNCDPTPTITSTDVTVASTTCPQEYTINRTWMAADDCGNSSTCLQVIVVDDSTPPVITCPANLTIECTASTAPGGTNGTATATDNCDATPTITSTDVTVASTTCPQEYTINRTWMAADDCGNTSTCLQIILVDDSTPPVITCPPNLTIECSVSSAPGGTNGTATATDNCDATPTITSTDVTVASTTCPQEYTINRTWMAADDCGNTSTCLQIILVDDSTPPVITCPPNLTIECTASTAPGGTNGTATATDNCDTTPTITSTDITVAGACPQEYTITRTWRATDDCGNSSTCNQTIFVDDSTPPVITCPANLTIECSVSSAPGGTNGTATATDNCDATPTITSTDVTVASTTCPQEYTINRTWMAADDCGNSSTCLQVIVVDDSTPPVILCPENITIECSSDTAPGGANGMATATDNCDATPTITSSDVVFPSKSCPEEYTIIRTWMATDDCGNSTACVQFVNVVDTTPPVITCPANTTIECDESTLPDSTGLPVVMDNCDEEPFVDYADVTFGFELCSEAYVITRTWMATDACGNSSTCVQVIAVVDTTPPVLTCPPDVTLDCTQSTAPSNTMEGVTTYTDETTFLSSSGPLTLESFENNMVGLNQNSIVTTNFTLDLLPPALLTGIYDVPVSGLFATDGVNYVGFQSDANGTATFNFNMSINSFGVNITDWGDFGNGQLTFSNDAGDNFVVAVSPMGNGNQQFFGVINSDMDFNQVVFTQTIGGEAYGIDEVYFGMAASSGMATATDNCDPDPALTYSDVITPGDCPQAYVITRTWRATDDCLNSSTCVQILNIDDTLPPSITECPADVTIECDASTSPDSTGTASATDICDPEVTLTYADVTVFTQELCPQSYNLERTWTASDDCGNTATCLQVITVIDTSAPVITCPPNLTIECTASSAPGGTNGMATATDNCDPAPTITSSDVTVAGACPQEYTITRTWQATDACNNSSTCIQVILVDDTMPPVITCPMPVTVQCASLQPVPDIASVMTSDSCDLAPVVTFVSDVTVNQTCFNQYMVNRTYRSTDACGNSSTCIQVITVFDDTPPSITCPTDVTVQCASDQPPQNIEAVTTSDNCSGPAPVVIFVSDVTVNQTCFNRYMVNRTYQSTDACGNSSTCVQVITVFDDTPPTITCPMPVTIQCASLQPAPDIAGVTTSDNCSGPAPVVTFVSDVTVNQTCFNRYMVNRTYRSTDACGNSATCVQVITVFDDTPPSITCPMPVTVQCASLQPAPNIASVTTSDNCSGPAPVVTFVSDVTVNQTCFNRYMVNRTYRSTDACGNSATCVQVITVFDNTPPTITCPAPVTVQCASQQPAPNIASVTTSDNCSGPAPVVTFVSDVTVNQTCFNRYMVNRTYRSTDACGNSATCVQVITVFDNTPPTITCPANLTVQCANLVPVPNPASVVTSDNCSGPAPVVTFISDVTTNQTCINRYTLTRTYRSTDACGNSATCTQVITVFDNTPPVITPVNPLLVGVPNNGTLEVQCFGQDPNWNLPTFGPADVTATDNCTGTVVLSFDDVLIDEGNCPVDGYINRYRLRWTATDACGNSSSYTVFLNLIDTIPPVILGVPEDITVNCDEVPEAPTLAAVDECLCACVVELQQDGPHPGCQDGQIITRTWEATDYCGNVTIEQQHITLVDNEGPVLTIEEPSELQGLPDGTLLEYTCNEGGIPAFFDDLSAESVSSPSVCDGLPKISFDENQIFSINCERFGYIQERTFTWTGVDACGNVTTLTITAHLIDTEPPVIVGVPDIACIGDPALDLIEAVDNCEKAGLIHWDVEIPNLCGDGTAFRRTYEAVDLCGNYARDTVILIPNDHVPPTLVFTNPDLEGLGHGEYISVECEANGDYYTPWGPDDVSFDDDCPGATLDFEQTVMQVYNGCENGALLWLQLTWTATDLCGNSSSLFLYVYVKDETPPVFDPFSHELTIDCNDEWPIISATDNCDEVIVTSMDSVIATDCEFEYDVIRTLTATDLCGNTVIAKQILHVGDHSGPDITGVDTLVCNDLTLPNVTAWDPCAEQFVPVTVTEVTLADDGCPGVVIERTFSATDICGNVAEVTQRIIINDTVPPIILVPTWSIIRKYMDNDHNFVRLSERDIIKQLNALNESSVFAYDLCDLWIVPVFTVDITLSENCLTDGWWQHRVYTWVATDVCGNSTVLTFSIDILDDLSPEIRSVPQDATVICGDLPDPPTLFADDDAGSILADFIQTIVEIPGEPGHFRVTRTWTAVDPCGNRSVATQSILWIPDTFVECDIILPPVVDCNSHGVVITSDVGGGIPPFTYVWDVIGQECFIQSGQGTPTITIYVGFFDVTISLTVTDAYGCQSVCTAVLDCFDPLDQFAGNPSAIGQHQADPNAPNNILQASNLDYLQALNYWPNPANTMFNISFTAAQERDVEISFMNFLGEVVLTDHMKSHVGANTRKIDVSKLPVGTYLFQVKTDKEIHAKGIVIMR